jgi:hypothetical protein
MWNLQAIDWLSERLASAIDGGVFREQPSVEVKASDVREYLERILEGET